MLVAIRCGVEDYGRGIRGERSLGASHPIGDIVLNEKQASGFFTIASRHGRLIVEVRKED